MPTAPRRAYDMHSVIEAIVDDGDFFEMKPEWARNVITGFARFGGQPVGIVANQPKVLGGTLDVNSADKAARFVWLCDAFGIPLVFLHDVPGFIVGSAVEKQGIIRHGAKMLFAVSEATVPKISVVLRKAYGAGYFVMNGTAYEADYIVAWPTAEIAVMGPDGMVNITMRKQLDGFPEGKERDAEPHPPGRASSARTSTRTSPPATPRSTTSSTRPRPATRSGTACRSPRTKQVARPWRKHGVLPV